MDEERQVPESFEEVPESFEEVGVTSRRSFLRRTAGTAAALVGLGSGALLLPGKALADPQGKGCSCIHSELHSVDCSEGPWCCSNDAASVVETFVGYACDNHNTVCWYMTSVLCICCCA